MDISAVEANSLLSSVVIKYPLRKKNIVTPRPPGTTLSSPACAKNTSKNAHALIPSRDGRYEALTVFPSGALAMCRVSIIESTDSPFCGSVREVAGIWYPWACLQWNMSNYWSTIRVGHNAPPLCRVEVDTDIRIHINRRVVAHERLVTP